MILRSQINKAVNNAKKWFYNEQLKGKTSIIYIVAKKHLRNDDFVIWYDEAEYKLDHIQFIESNADFQGETDGVTIWINKFYEWNDTSLELFLIHEALHFTIRRKGIHDIPEYKEHNIMEQINKNLII